MSQSYLEQLSIPVVVLDAALRITYCNAAAVTLLNKPPAALLHQLVGDVFPEWHDSDLARAVQTCLATGAPQTMQGWWRGRCFSFQATGVDASVLLTAHDVTEYQHALRDLQEHKTNLSVIMDAISESLGLIAADGTILAINSAGAQRLHTTPRDAVGKCVFDYYHQEPQLAVSRRQRIGDVLASGTPVHFEDRRGGRDYANWIYPVPPSAGQSARVVVFATDVTDLRRQERELRASEARYRAIVQDQTEFICRFTPDCILTFVNDAYCSYFGKAPFELLGMSFLNLVPPADHAGIRAHLANLTPQVPALMYEHCACDRHGKQRWQQWTNRAFFDPQGTLLEYQSVGRDITERKQVEDQLRHANQRFQQLAEQSRTIIWEVDATGLVTYASPTVETILGFRPEDVIGKLHFYDFHPAEDHNAFKAAALAEFARNAEFRNVESRLMTAAGRCIWISTNGIPVLDAAGNLIGYRGADTDITDRHQAQIALAESEKRYRALYENLPLTTVTWQMNGDDFVLINVNRAAEEESDAKADHLIGQRASVLYHNQPAMRDILRDTAQSRGRQQRDLQYTSLLRHKLHSITCTCGFVPPDLVIMHIEDISRRRHAESKLRHYQRQLRALAAQLTLAEERERRRIAADLHDHVCQTLAAIKLKLGMLADAHAMKPAAADLHGTATMLDQCIRATRNLSFDLSPPVLYELGLDAALEWLADHLHTKHLAIHVATSGEPAVLSDDLRILLFIVTREIVLNAIKHAGAHAITITRSVAADQLRITVQDDGRGFATGKPGALRARRGFGLFSIRERLRNVGGAIAIATAPGAGTTVEIAVPLGQDAERP